MKRRVKAERGEYTYKGCSGCLKNEGGQVQLFVHGAAACHLVNLCPDCAKALRDDIDKALRGNHVA